MSETDVEYLVIYKHTDTGQWHIEACPSVDDARTTLSLVLAIGHKAAGITFRHKTEPSAIVEVATHA
jgi:hypothetical protein